MELNCNSCAVLCLHEKSSPSFFICIPFSVLRCVISHVLEPGKLPGLSTEVCARVWGSGFVWI